MRGLGVLGVWVLLLVVPSGAWAIERVAVPATLGAVLELAQPGDVVVLGAGDYGRFRGASKSGLVTIRAAAGAPVRMSIETGPGISNLRLEGVTITGGYVNGGRNLQFVDSRVTGYLRVDTPGAEHGIVFDGVSFDGIDLPGNAYEGRLSIRGYGNSSDVGVTIRNSHFGGGGCSDGVQIVGGANGVQILDNTFEDLLQGSCGPHVDAIQGYGERNTVIDGNFFGDVDVAVGFYDGTNGLTITDNVLVGLGSGQIVQIGQAVNTLFAHNTVRNSTVSIGSKTSTPSTGTLRDNVLLGAWFLTSNGGGCRCTVSHNLFSSGAGAGGGAGGGDAIVATPVFVGGGKPTSYGGHALAAGSPGKANASDGSDRGIRTGPLAPTRTPMPATPTSTPALTPTPTFGPTVKPRKRSGSGPVASYGFDERRGTRVRDASGNRNHGSLVGARRVAGGRHGGALWFDGHGDFVAVASDPTLELAGELTLEAWIRPASRDARRRTVLVKREGPYVDYGLYAPGRHGAGAKRGRWTHVAVTCDGALLRMYVDGRLVGSQARSGRVRTHAGRLLIGGGPAGRGFRGRIEDVRLYARALDPSEIREDMRSPA